MDTEKPPRTMRKILAIAVSLAVVCFLLSWGGYRLLDRVPTFLVSRITIVGTQQCDQKRIKELTDPVYGQCIFKINLSDLHQKILAISWIKSLSIRRVMPSTLEIRVQERVPVGIIRADQLYLVDSDGVLIDVVPNKPSASATIKAGGETRRQEEGATSPSPPDTQSPSPSGSPVARKDIWSHLPLITGLNLSSGAADGGGSCSAAASINAAVSSHGAMSSVGCKVDFPCLKSALEAVALMQDMRALWLAEVSEINVKDPENIILCSKSMKGTAREIRLGTNDNLREKLMYLQTTWSSIRALRQSLAERASGIEYIDLRYKNQLIVKPLLKKTSGGAGFQPALK